MKFEEAIKKYDKMCISMAGKFMREPVFSFDDAYNVALFSIKKAIDKFDPSKNISLTTLVYVSMRRDLMRASGSVKGFELNRNLFAKNRHKELKEIYNVVSNISHMAFKDDILDNRDFEKSIEIKDIIKSILPKSEQEIINRIVMNQERFSEVAAEKGHPNSNEIRLTYKKGLRKLKKYWEKNHV